MYYIGKNDDNARLHALDAIYVFLLSTDYLLR